MKISFIAIILGLVSSNFAQAAQCPHRIVFLPQTHAADREVSNSRSADDKIKVAGSQLEIAKYIDANLSLPVFSEQAADNTFVWSALPEEAKRKARDTAKQSFSEGLPDSLYSANESQIDQLYEIDAATLELIREKIPTIHRVISPSDYKRVFGAIIKWTQANPDKPWSPQIEKLVRDERETLALKEINSFFSANPRQRDVILIYGGNHNFSIYPDLFEPACVVVPYQFQRSWYGKSRGGYKISTNMSSGSARSAR